MGPNRQPGPAGHPDGHSEPIDDGTTARTRTAPPATLGTPAIDGAQANANAATGACAYLNPRLSGTVRAPQDVFDRLRGASGAATIGTARAKDSQAWPYGAATAASEQDVAIDGRTIVVVRPDAAAASGKNLATTAQVAEALRALPANQRALTSKVLLSPNPHPDSTANSTVAGEAGSGVITLFPVRSAQSQNDFDNRVMHESGHNYQGSLWNSGAAVQEWQAAATSDHRLPSPYAGANTGDDFCEFGILFNAARGTPCEASAKDLYPNRWAKMMGYQGN